MASPFVKWVGGKGQLTDILRKIFNLENIPEHATYIEPFVGGGAFYFHVASSWHLERYILGDTNSDLMFAYTIIHDDPEKLITILAQIEKEYLSLSDQEKADYYEKTVLDNFKFLGYVS